MRNGLVQLGAWAAATGAAVALSWYGVHAVLSEAAVDRPQAVPLPTAPAAALPSLPPAASGVAASPSGEHRPSPSPSPPAASTATTQSGPPTVPSPIRSQAASSKRSATPSTVRSYLVPGGRVALDIRPDSAELVSATPDTGWQMQVWNGDHWMRIDFTKDGAANSVFVTWNGHAPDVQTVVR